jgi:hypothetical protein
VLEVPSGAVLAVGDTTYDFPLIDGDKIRRTVTVGLTGEGTTRITSGLTAGATVVPARRTTPMAKRRTSGGRGSHR